MRWKFLLTAGLMAAIPFAAHADNTEIALTPDPEWAAPAPPIDVPDDAQGIVFFRAQDTIVHLTEDATLSYTSQIVRILQPQALEVGNIAIGWNPASGQAAVHSLKIRRGSRVIDVLENSQFEILRREDQLEAAMLDGMLTAVLQVPDLRVGDDLEIAYTVPMHDPTLGETSHGLMFLAEAPPSGRFSLQLSWEDGQEPQIQLTPDFEAIAQRRENSIALRFENPDIISSPRVAPPRYGWTRMFEYSDFDGWEQVSSRFHDLFKDASTLPDGSALREEAAIIRETYDTPLEQAQAALKLVQQQTRYIYIGLNGGNFTPAHADETWDRRYGDCKGKTAMLLALLSELGIEAEGVLVNNSSSTDGLDTKLANPGLFDHIIVRASIGGQEYYLDGTLPAVIEGRTDPFLPYTWILPLTQSGSDIERIPDRIYTMPQIVSMEEIDASAGFDEPARRVQTSLSRGAAGLQQHLQLSSVTSNQLTSVVRSRLVGTAQWDDIETVEYRYDKATQASILTITGTGPVGWDELSDGSYDYTLPGGGFNEPQRRQRPASQDREAPYFQASTYTCAVTTVRLPQDTDIKDWGFNSVFDTMLFGRVFYRMMELREDKTLRMVTGSRVEQQEITQERAQRDNQRLPDFDNSTAVLSYDQGGMDNSWGRLRPVAATFETDWTGAEPPCLPDDVLGE